MSPAELVFALKVKREQEYGNAMLIAQMTARATWGDGTKKEK